MLDIKWFRETPEIVEANLKKRGMDTAPVQEIKKLDEEWRKKQYELNQLRKERNEINAKISGGQKEAVPRAKKLKLKMTELESLVPELEKKLRKSLMKMPNILHEAVPVGKDDSENVPMRYRGTPLVKKSTPWNYPVKTREADFELKNHIDLLMPKYADIERAAKTSGARFYYLKGKLVELELALERFAFDFLKKKGFTLIEPPYLLRKKAMEGVVHFSDFEDTIYKIEGEDLYLIATAEHPLGAMHMDELLNTDELPLKYAGISPSFRKEAGSHGRDTKGFFRVHRFNKIEQFVFSKPKESQKIHEELIGNAEELFKALEIPHRVVEICTGDIGYVAARKYDLEAWLPGQGKFREMVSCSNCTDWQARRLNIRHKKGGEKPEFVHTLNSTAFALQRTMIAIVENNQQEDGTIKIPKVLQNYLEFKEL